LKETVQTRQRQGFRLRDLRDILAGVDREVSPWTGEKGPSDLTRFFDDTEEDRYDRS
jgi:hypothetical protein